MVREGTSGAERPATRAEPCAPVGLQGSSRVSVLLVSTGAGLLVAVVAPAGRYQAAQPPSAAPARPSARHGCALNWQTGAWAGRPSIDLTSGLTPPGAIRGLPLHQHGSATVPRVSLLRVGNNAAAVDLEVVVDNPPGDRGHEFGPSVTPARRHQANDDDETRGHEFDPSVAPDRRLPGWSASLLHRRLASCIGCGVSS